MVSEHHKKQVNRGVRKKAKGMTTKESDPKNISEH